MKDNRTLQATINKFQETARFLEAQAQLLGGQAQACSDASFIMDALGIGIWKWDVITDSLEWDRNMYQLYGVQAEDFSGAYDAWEKSLSPATKAKALEEIQAAVRGEREFDTTFQVVHKTGKVQEIRTRAFVIRDEEGKALKMWGINIDRNREVALEKAVKREQDFNTSVLNSVTAAIAVINHEGVIISVNEAWKRFAVENGLELGQSAPNTGVGTNYLAVFQSALESIVDHKEELITCRNNIQAVLEGTLLNFNMEYPCHSSEQQRWFSMTVTPLHLDHGGAVISHTEITDRKLSEQKINQAAKLASLGEMSAGIAHEIKNPLTTIILSIGILEKLRESPTKFALTLGNIKKANTRILKIVKGLTDFSHSEEVTDFKNHSLSEIVKEALALTDANSKSQNTHVTCDLKDAALINCDEIAIEQVLVNLINNSIDAVKTHNQKWVKVEVAEETHDVVLRVIDSGPGIPDKIQKNIFMPFFTTKPIGEGTGLGLSVTKKILDQHHATINVLPHGPNTCFEIRFKKAEV